MITNYIAQNFLTLTVDITHISNEEIIAKYSKETALSYLERKNHLAKLTNETGSNDLYIPLRVELFNTKNKKKADVLYSIDTSSDEKIRLVKTEIDPSNKYNLTRKNVIDGINKQLATRKITFNYVSHNGENIFNHYTLGLISKYYNLYERFSYTFVSSTRYSQQLIDEILRIIINDPNVIQNIRNKKR